MIVVRQREGGWAFLRGGDLRHRYCSGLRPTLHIVRMDNLSQVLFRALRRVDFVVDGFLARLARYSSNAVELAR